MPNQLVTGTVSPLTFRIGKPNDAPTLDITSKIDRDSIRIEETGNHEAAHCDFEFIDLTLANTAIRGRWNLQVFYRGNTLFRGIIGQVRPEIKAKYGNFNMSARDIGSILDDDIIKVFDKNGGPIRRNVDESDKARIQWLLGGNDGQMGLGVVGQNAINVDWSKVQVLEPHMDAQWFPPRLSARQALERILGATGDDSANYYVDQAGRLHTFDDAHPESSTDAPYDIVVGHTLGAGEIGPIDLQHEWDSEHYFNGYFVRAPSRALSRFFTDAHPDLALSSPFAHGYFGDRFTYIDAPDADTEGKVRRVARKALRDTRNPVPRGSFTVEGDRCWNGSTRFTSGQLLYVEAPQFDLRGNPSGGGSSDTGDWAGNRSPQPFRIVRNTITTIDGGNNLRMEIEYGGRRPHLYEGGTAS